MPDILEKAFSALVEKALPEMKNGTIMLSRQEKVLEADGNQEFAQPDIEDLVIARNTIFCPQQGIYISKRNLQ